LFTCPHQQQQELHQQTIQEETTSSNDSKVAIDQQQVEQEEQQWTNDLLPNSRASSLVSLLHPHVAAICRQFNITSRYSLLCSCLSRLVATFRLSSIPSLSNNLWCFTTLALVDALAIREAISQQLLQRHRQSQQEPTEAKNKEQMDVVSSSQQDGYSSFSCSSCGPLPSFTSAIKQASLLSSSSSMFWFPDIDSKQLGDFVEYLGFALSDLKALRSILFFQQ
jgi:hypothetical protein